MPINSTHPLYDANHSHWQRCRDVYRGEDAVKSRGVAYLPKPSGLDKAEYEAYKTRALFYEAPGRTIDGFVGAISRKDAVIEAPEALQPFLDDATADGMSLNELTKAACIETILQNRGGILVDFDDLLQRPYLAIYQVEAITNWSKDQIVLRETVYEADPEDAFKQIAVEQYRQLAIEEGVYTVTIWRKAKGAQTPGTEWIIHDTNTPHIRGRRFDTIPFYWLTSLGNTSRIEAPPLLGLVNVCLAHYRNSADLEHGCHFTGLPTPYIIGNVAADTPIRIGSTAFLVVPSEPGAAVGFMEFSGQGLGAIKDAMADKKEMMAALGATAFHDAPKGVEAAATARIRTSGETSLLAGVTTAVETTLKAALECAARWMGISEKVEITLNREFVETTMDGPTLTALVAAFQAGAISLPQFLYNLQQGELLAPDTDIEEEVSVVEGEQKKRADEAVALALATKPKPTKPGA